MLQCSYCYGECEATLNGLADHIATCPAIGISDAEVDAMRAMNDPERAAWALESERLDAEKYGR